MPKREINSKDGSSELARSDEASRPWFHDVRSSLLNHHVLRPHERRLGA